MADIWLTAAAEAAFSELQATAPDQADAVSDAINNITAADGRRIDLPGAPAAEPFLAIEPRHPDAPAVIYRHAANGEPGKWLVVSLMNRDDYNAARQAEQAVAATPPAVRELINGVVAGTVATVDVTAPTGTVTQGGAAATTRTTDKASWERSRNSPGLQLGRFPSQVDPRIS